MKYKPYALYKIYLYDIRRYGDSCANLIPKSYTLLLYTYFECLYSFYTYFECLYSFVLILNVYTHLYLFKMFRYLF